ncbi:MAG: NADH-quinone oxidoreductase subunit [Mucilaginibacter sp.]|uniref:NADH-quinone oxidoreductase subunit 5 family protein n=1 Tax=Mucilaginibacter sp. TaxID=1882438 RepID=UPI0026313F7C|nr:NADH-quinone oxidoreductase subunit L [Mucilaginibacter sp.]MDB5002393.1 NADH-quinone oxidoreductase subunit [Mucilaginibacter sp.]
MKTTIPYQDLSIIYFAIATVLLPLFACIVNCCLSGRRNQISGWIATGAILASAILSIIIFSKTWNSQQIHVQQLWFTIGGTQLYAGILLNNLSSILLLLVSVIALPVHIYSTAYMKHDDNYDRYFIYLSLFCFSMLALVVADNMILLYTFWELVGFSSYLLIGFWFTRDKAVQANKKAFLMNRIGDVGLLTAIMILFAQYHTFDIVQIFGSGGLISQSTITNGLWVSPIGSLPAVWQYVAFGGIFLGVAAKSAQFPLHTWLPDAMEGPTSVSALIHAATMVAAGVFLLGRVYPIFTTGELDILAIIGCFTAFMAATIALTQNDLKRILAYSTISQLGFMVMAMGVGAYASSLFHLITHAFFKCALFLVAGIVIHQMQHIKEDNDLDIDPQSILYMGGLRKKLPFTFLVAVVAGLALIGLPFTSGYLSKDGILVQAVDWSDNKSILFRLVPIGAIITTWLTAFYVTRLIVKVFFGDFRLAQFHPHIKYHISDGGWQYRVPLLLLAVACLFPLFSWNPVLYERAWVLAGFDSIHLARVNIYHTIVPIGVNILSLFIIYWAWAVYTGRKILVFPQTGFLFHLSYREWYFDKFYNKVIVGAVMGLSKALSWFDRKVIDGFINGLSVLTITISKIAAWFDYNIIDRISRLLTFIVQITGNFVRRFQGGKIQYYLFSMLAVVLAMFILKILI